jgi:anti-sigma factor RsiW
MHCRKARLALVDRDLGTLGRDAAVRLEQHLQRCPACATEARIDAQWIAELARLRQAYPLPLDVAGRVVARVRDAERVERVEVHQRQLAWATVAAVACGLLFVFGAWSTLPEPGRLVEDGSILLGSAKWFFELVTTPLATLFGVVVTLVGSLLKTLAAVGSAMKQLLPAAWVATGLACLAMAATISAIVGRDLLGPAPAYARKER